MYFWIIPSIVVSILILLSLTRSKIPRDPGKEGIDDNDSVLAYDQVSRWFIFSIIRYLAIRQLNKYSVGGDVVDAGCGPGYLALSIARQFPQTRITGIDLSQEMLERAKINISYVDFDSRVTFLKADVHRMPFQNDSVDFVISTLSLHHWSDPLLAIDEIYRILKPGGRLMILDLRRDTPRLLFYTVFLVQQFLAPTPIRRVNGGIGSFWSSYTPSEMQNRLALSSFKRWEVHKGWGWFYIHGKK
jgi:ubiquinone/menaquinone biosynthesis C-methylase UbiE